MMNKFFAKDVWNLENLKERLRQLRNAVGGLIDNFLKAADGRLDRKYKLALSLIFVVLLAVVSWVTGSKIQSPAEAAARTAPPTPSPILVPVEERVLTADVITRGTARFGLPQSISLAPSPLKSEAGVITTLPARGDQLKEGDVLLTASGRPVFLLQGDVPAYRDLTSGLSGEDIRQLETALKRLKFDPIREYREALDDLAEETDRLQGLVENLLQLARGEQGLKLHKEEINLSFLLADVARIPCVRWQTANSSPSLVICPRLWSFPATLTS